MTQGPWSVKGIDPKARAAAREKAGRRGVTLGEYLNTLLLDEDEVEAQAAPAASPTLRAVPPAPTEMQVVTLSRGDGGPDDIRRLSSEIDKLSQKLETTQVRSQRAVSSVDKAVIGLMGKVDTTSRAQLGALERVSRALSDIEAAQQALRSRIDGVENGGGSADALRTLEASLGRLAETVAARTDTLEHNQNQFRDLFDARVDAVANRVDGFARSIDAVIGDAVRRMEAQGASASGLSDRIDAVEGQMSAAERRMESALGRITDAASRFEMFESKAERAASDATWRMERAVEASNNRSRALSKELTDRVDGIEEKNRDAMGAFGDAISRINDRLARAERNSESAISQLERSIQSMSSNGKLEEEVTQFKNAFQKRLDTLAEDMSRPLHALRADVERRIEDAVRTGTPEKVERLERTIRLLQDKLEDSEGRQADAVEAMSGQVERMSRAVEERLRSVEGRASGVTLDDVRREIGELAEAIDNRLGDGVEMRLAAQEMGSRELVKSIDKRFKEAEQARAEDRAAVARISEDMAQRQDEGLKALQSRFEEMKTEGSGEDLSGLADRFEERIRDSERRSAEAIVQIGEQVARVADRLANQNTDTLRRMEERLADSERTHETRLSDALSDMSRRLEEVGEQTTSAMNPVHQRVSSIAKRLAEVEDGKRPVAPSPAPLAAVAAPTLDEFIVLDDIEPQTVHIDTDLLDADEQPQDRSFADILADEEEDASVIGVEPPPFDRAAEAALFDAPAKPVEAAEAPATEIEDLLDTNDVVLEPPSPQERAAELMADLPDAPASNRPADYIAEARRAAQQGRRVNMVTAPDMKRGMGRGPIIASTALALAVAGGGAWTVMRGKQDTPTPEPVAKADPAAPYAPEGDHKAAADMLFDAGHPAPDASAATEHADEGFVPTQLPGKADAAPTLVAGKDAKAAKPALRTEPTVKVVTLDSAVEAGDPVALYDYANQLLAGGDKPRAVGLLKEAAAKGLVMAQYRLAKLYEKGEGVPRDIAASRAWTEKAAIGGNVKAEHDFAVFFAEGDSGPQSYAAAVEWFKRAAEHGLVDSQYNLAVLYEQGLGVSQDKAEAAFWYELAGRSGDSDGARKAREIFNGMQAAQAEQIKRRARTWTAKSAIPRANGDLGKRPWDVATPEQVTEAQRLLERLGYTPGAFDGKASAKTVQAIKAFEADNNLPVTGEATTALLRQLKAATLNAGG